MPNLFLPSKDHGSHGNELMINDDNDITPLNSFWFIYLLDIKALIRGLCLL